MHPGFHGYQSAATERYLHQSGQVQEQLHKILTQMSGFALLLLTRRAAPSLCAGPLDMARTRMTAAREDFRALTPSSRSALHHHHHLGEATGAVEHCVRMAFECLRTNTVQQQRDELAKMLRTALGHLQATSRILPGFEMVDLRQACCAAHATQADIKFAATAA